MDSVYTTQQPSSQSAAGRAGNATLRGAKYVGTTALAGGIVAFGAIGTMWLINKLMPKFYKNAVTPRGEYTP